MATVIGLTVLSGAATNRCSASQVADIVEYFDTDVLYTRQANQTHFLRDCVPDSVTVAYHNPRSRGAERVTPQNDVELVTVTSPSELAAFAADGLGARQSELFVLSDLLSVSINLTALETELSGLSAYQDALDGAGDGVVHLTTGANPSYRGEWAGISVQGVMPGANEQQGTPTAGVAHLELRRNGVVLVKTRTLSDFGLETVTGVAHRRAETLNNAEIRSRTDLAQAEVYEIAQLDGIGKKTARTIVESAEVVEQREARVAPDESLPSREPIFIDIETDGLNPTMVWLIGVVTRTSGDRFIPFIETDPEKPAAALRAFMDWLAELGRNRPIVAYNGWQFDFPVIEEHVAEHCPEHNETWANATKFDLYHWAVTKNNALLPGITNKLADVASALGWEDSETGLTGRAVGRRFQRYAENPGPETELEWERHKRYCEDDVRALVHVYDRIADTETLMTQTGESTQSAGTESTQGTLADFSR
ncbi:ribonuclease H-like domain-containing protein [Halobacterium salinarum]|uniref:ribonuclease H-like domain-containing protein n=1 Tax=Halobacterium salinarum TaxID=2242 RepID=UPI00298BD2B3|nr:ribonuclease H-like domain-containing protein [Halobacterium salinarum]MCF2237626.1 ribonuclease H-like domain-containing protein [Halobacterium salinarum]